MTGAGYSNKSLADKLGLKIGDNISILNAPASYDELIENWPVGVSVSRDALDESFTFIHYFATKQAKLAKDFPALKEHLDSKGRLWISWPKQTGQQKQPIKSNVTENVVREIGLANGLVDVKVAAIDETWSGLKFVYRLKDR